MSSSLSLCVCISPTDTSVPTSTVAGPAQATSRPVSSRSTGLRGDMMRRDSDSAPAISGTNERREQPIAQSVTNCLSRPVSGLSRPVSGLSRPVSGRTTGLRGQLVARTHSQDISSGCREERKDQNEGGTRSQPHSRPASGRVTGLRGLLASQRGREGSELAAPVVQCSSEPDLRHQPRPGTAVLAWGHRLLRVGPLETDVVPLPTITSGSEGGEAEAHLTPTMSTEEPCDSTHLPRPPSDLEECLASISHFDHTHLGQLGRDQQGDHH